MAGAGKPVRRARGHPIAIGAGTVAYVLAIVWSSRHPSGWTLVLVALPWLWMALAHARTAADPGVMPGQRLLRVLPLLVLGLLLASCWNLWVRNVALLLLVQHVAIHLGLAALFGLTLRPGRTPLCTQFADLAGLDVAQPSLASYTRQVTWAWTLFFIGMSVASLGLYALVDAGRWTFFSAVIGPVLTAAMFLFEDLARRIFLPPENRVGLTGTWRAIRARARQQGPWMQDVR